MAEQLTHMQELQGQIKQLPAQSVSAATAADNRLQAVQAAPEEEMQSLHHKTAAAGRERISNAAQQQLTLLQAEQQKMLAAL
jgi:hypothetical protein